MEKNGPSMPWVDDLTDFELKEIVRQAEELGNYQPLEDLIFSGSQRVADLFMGNEDFRELLVRIIRGDVNSKKADKNYREKARKDRRTQNIVWSVIAHKNAGHPIYCGGNETTTETACSKAGRTYHMTEESVYRNVWRQSTLSKVKDFFREQTPEEKAEEDRIRKLFFPDTLKLK